MERLMVMEKITLTAENETLFIPLYSKAEMSREGKILSDKKAEEIVKNIDYDFSKNKISRYVNIYMGLRAAIIDDYVNQFLQSNPRSIVLHLGCGLDSRIERVVEKPILWYDLDMPDVIKVRKKFYAESENYRMISASVTDLHWLNTITRSDLPTLIIAEGLTMYLTEEEMKELFLAFQKKFDRAVFIFDAYSLLSVKISQYKNPVNKMGATIRWGLDSPQEIKKYADGITHLETKYFTNDKRIERLGGFTKSMFKLIYSNNFMKNLYRIYIFQINKPNTIDKE
ncbi:class I SAM-dependent methyltransferase [Candidatus Formimonas warabiya]|nr:class I SAM-dependent methyltransferase [Candidatus Formimonas warabiya]